QVVLTDSHGISLRPCHFGSSPSGTQHYGYGAHTLSGRPFKTVHLCLHYTPHQSGRTSTESPTTPPMQRPPAITHGNGLAGCAFAIRASWDQRSVINSPRLIADSYVLLRLLMPRHPPCALKNLTTQRSKTYSREPRPLRARFIHKKLL